MKILNSDDIQSLINKGNLAQAEVYLRLSLQAQPENPVLLNFLGAIASAANQPQFAVDYFTQAAQLAPDWHLPQANLQKTLSQLKPNDTLTNTQTNDLPSHPEASPDKTEEKFLVIKSWGCGFCADIAYVLAQLLLAEITGRTPVVHWGSNSLFNDSTDDNAFDYYFEPVSYKTVEDLQCEDFEFWPPKWNYKNLKTGEVNKTTGPYSRVAGLYLLGRPEKVIVADFYTGIVDLMPWIPAGHPLYGLPIDELYRQLAKKHLQLKKGIIHEVDAFFQQHLAAHDFIAVHARGSDKAAEVGNILGHINSQYTAIINRHLSTHPDSRIFLMTDDVRILNHISSLYGDRVITTECQRTQNNQGIHYQSVTNPRQLGTEVLIDIFLATRATAFIGNGLSNPSLIVYYLRYWTAEEAQLLGQNVHHILNTLIHDW